MMAMFWKTCGVSLMAAVLVLTLGKQEKDLALLLGMGATILVLTTAFLLLEPVLEFLHRLESMGQLQSGSLGTLLRITGIGITAEICTMILADSGNSSLAKGIQLLSTVVILNLSLPILENLIDLIQSILGGL